MEEKIIKKIKLIVLHPIEVLNYGVSLLTTHFKFGFYKKDTHKAVKLLQIKLPRIIIVPYIIEIDKQYYFFPFDVPLFWGMPYEGFYNWRYEEIVSAENHHGDGRLDHGIRQFVFYHELYHHYLNVNKLRDVEYEEIKCDAFAYAAIQHLTEYNMPNYIGCYGCHNLEQFWLEVKDIENQFFKKGGNSL